MLREENNMTKEKMVDYIVKLLDAADTKRVRIMFILLTHALS